MRVRELLRSTSGMFVLEECGGELRIRDGRSEDPAKWGACVSLDGDALHAAAYGVLVFRPKPGEVEQAERIALGLDKPKRKKTKKRKTKKEAR